jgi:RNA polymerase sigma-70 factor (ECF subfamily)
MTPMSDLQPNDLLARAAAGDSNAWGDAVTQHRDRLVRMVAFRLDPRLRGRIDAADVVQEGFLQAIQHQRDFFRLEAVPLFLWLRGIVANKLLETHRYHLGTQMRAAAREAAAAPRAEPDATSVALLDQLTGHATRPSVAVRRVENKTRLENALNSLDPIDREVLALRHFEQLSSSETAQVLGILERAASKRYVRALKRLKEVLAELPGGLTELKS